MSERCRHCDKEFESEEVIVAMHGMLFCDMYCSGSYASDYDVEDMLNSREEIKASDIGV